MRKFTLDTNCIIDLDENRPNAVFVQKIVAAWRTGQVELAVVAVTASENQQSKKANRDFGEFENKLVRVGLKGVYHLLPMMKWDVFYWDHALWSEEQMEVLYAQIQEILFPDISLVPPEDIELNSSWRNKACDVLVAWSHAHHKWDILVTSDTNFHKKRDKLQTVGVNEILYPKEAASLCTP